jgi:hypothetical protein
MPPATARAAQRQAAERIQLTGRVPDETLAALASIAAQERRSLGSGRGHMGTPIVQAA